MRPLRGRPLALLHSPGPAGLQPRRGSEAPRPHASGLHGHHEPSQQLRPLPCQRPPVAELLPPSRGACRGEELTSGRVAGLSSLLPLTPQCLPTPRSQSSGEAPGLGVWGSRKGGGGRGAPIRLAAALSHIFPLDLNLATQHWTRLNLPASRDCANI